MSFSQIKEHGSGPIEYRLKIEGLPLEFVTSEALALTTSDGIERVNGLQRKGLKISERAILPEGDLQADGMKFKVIDFQEKLTNLFNRQAENVTRLRGDYLSGGSPTALVEEAIFPSGSFVYLGTETLKATGASSSISQTFQRGQAGSIEYSHYVDRTWSDGGRPLLTDVPLYLQTRRCWLYAYGQNDDFAGTGSVIWRGVITGEPDDNEGLYLIPAAHISKRLENQFGLSEGELQLRGIFHPLNWTLQIRVTEYQSYPLTGAFEHLATNTTTIQSFGLKETASDLVSDLNSQLFGATSAWSSPCEVRLIQGRLAVLFRTAGASPRPVIAKTLNGIYVDQGPLFTIDRAPFEEFIKEEPPGFDTIHNGYFFPIDPGTGTYDSDEIAYEVSAGSHYACIAKQPYPSVVAPYIWTHSPDFLPDIGCTRLHLDAPSLPAGIEEISFPDAPQENWIFGITASSTADRWIEAGHFRPTPRDGNRFVFFMPEDYAWFDVENPPAGIIPSINCQVGSCFHPSGSVADFMKRVCELSPHYATNGTIPWITTEDFDAEDAINTFSGVVDSSWHNDRNFIFYGEAVELKEVVLPELMGANCTLATTAEGKITFKRFKLASPSSIGIASASYSDLLTDRRLPSRTYVKDGLYPVAAATVDYSPISQEASGLYRAKFADALDTFKNAKTLLIEKKTQRGIRATFTGREDPTEVLNALRQLVTVFGVPQIQLTVDVPMTYFDTLLYDEIKITNDTIPNTQTGRRGVTNQCGIVTGREWDLESGRGTLTILINTDNVAGYTPSAWVYSGSINGANVHLSISSSHYAPGSNTDSSYFQVGDYCKLIEHDSAFPLSASLTVVSAGSSEIVCSTGSFFYMTYPATLQYHSSASVAEAGNPAQLNWCFIGSGSTDPDNEDLASRGSRVFGP